MYLIAKLQKFLFEFGLVLGWWSGVTAESPGLRAPPFKGDVCVNNFWKSVDTRLTWQGMFGETKIPNSLIIRVRDLELWYSRRGSNPGHPD